MIESDEKPQWWIFTFGQNSINAGHYVKIRGTYSQARQKMFKRYGNDWAFQYLKKEWDEMEFPNKEIELTKGDIYGRYK